MPGHPAWGLAVCLLILFETIPSIGRGEPAPAQLAAATFEDCYARWDAHGLTVGNDFCERRWIWTQNQLKSVSFRTKNPDTEWLAPVREAPHSPTEMPAITVEHGHFGPVEAAALRLTLQITNPVVQTWEIKIFPRFAGLVVTTGPRGQTNSIESSLPGTGIEANALSTNQSLPSAAGDYFPLAGHHLKMAQAELTDQTDSHNELVAEREWLVAPNESTFTLMGNPVWVENVLTGAGLVLLKLAPCQHATGIKTEPNFSFNPRNGFLSTSADGYPLATLAYQGGRTGLIAILQQFQRHLRVPDYRRDGLFLSNTWGDRSRDARINEAFIRREIAAAERLGIDVLQIDDGWQKGRSRNSAQGNGAWGGWWAADAHFWEPDPKRFPQGLQPLVTMARTNGIKLGLWFSPDASQQAQNWPRDAECLLAFYRELGINYFKIDGMDTSDRNTAANEKRLFDKVLRDSDQKVVFDLDVTAGNRPGYFGLPDIGPVFVENRYTDWRNYWPHQTLRNLWHLAQYVDPLRLRIELLNQLRNTTNYGADPLAPANYRSDTLFAMAMTANPLAWFEVSGLNDQQMTDLVPLVKIWKQHRARYYAGSLIPIGGLPDGIVWTGFASVAQDQGGGYLLFFRELNDRAEMNFDLTPFFRPDLQASILAGRGSICQTNQHLQVKIPQPLDYLWLQLQPKTPAAAKIHSLPEDAIPAKVSPHLPRNHSPGPPL